ncbi:hypothetical protein [Chitinophaga sp. Cy-1792]|uniref:hypothetical protein n=1 Tax=Chitinophaga sp. Cy-1792 TaxID=2608339 RepID=UPI0014205EC6|nr:hypothetical protein [Chitinophaga sp. Cy-1792]NIG54582.1 hypothetical protein [Chitinophaga sp. Cy-1792]
MTNNLNLYTVFTYLLYALAAVTLLVVSFRLLNKKKPVPAALRSAAIIKINSYKSFGIMATIRFNDAGAPNVGDQIKQEGDTYRIKGVIVESPLQHDQVWECKLEKM